MVSETESRMPIASGGDFPEIRRKEDLFIEICEAEQEIREGKVSSDLFVEQKQDIKQEVQEHTDIVDDFSNDIDIPEPEDFDDDSIPF